MRTPIVALSLAWTAALASGSPSHGQAIPDSIAAEGVPEVPEDLVRHLNRYQNIRSAAFQDWLGDRREMYITTRFADTNQVHQVASPGAARYQLTFRTDRVLGALRRPSRDQFLFTADEGGAENYQFFLFEPGQDARRVTDGRSRHTSPKWSNAGRLLAYSSNARNGKDMDLYLMDPSDPDSARILKEVSGSWGVSDWSPDDRRVAAVEYISANESYVHLIDVDSGRVETVTPRPTDGAPTVAYANVRWSKDGRAIYWTTDLDSEFLRLVRRDLTSGATTSLTASIPWDVDEFDLSDDGRTIALVANEDGIARVRVLDAATGREAPAPRLPAGQIGGLMFRRGSTEFAFNLSSARSTGDAYSYDLATGQLARWTRSEVGGLDPESFAEPDLVRYKTFDGRSIPAFVYRPPASKFKAPRPVLIDIHGGPEGQFRLGFLGRMNYLVDELGIALVYPNVRGSAGYGKSYLKLDNGFLREDAVKDIGALLDWISGQPDLDASRVAVAGGSYGGYMSLATMIHHGDRLRAGIDVVGISSFLTFLKNTQGYRRDLRRAEYGDERDPKMYEHLRAISPLSSVEKIIRPLLVVAGQNDPRVPASESEQVVAEVRKGGVPVWYIVGKNEGHGFAKKPNQDYQQFAQILFLKQYLLGEAPGPGH